MLSNKELEILKYLRENSRLTVTQIGRKLNMPRTTVFDKIKKFRKEGIISKYTCVIDFNKLGKSIITYVLFKADPETKRDFGEALQKSSFTNSVVKIGNDFDYMASFVFENINDLHNYLDLLGSKYKLKDYKVLYTAEKLKQEGFICKAS